MADGATWRENLDELPRQRLKRRHAQLKTERQDYDAEWRELAEYYSPRNLRYIQDTQTSQNRARPVNTRVVRNTPLTARDVFVAGMMSGLTSPARPWFRLTTPDPGLAEYGPVKSWLFRVEQRMREVFARSNFYNALPTCYGSLGTFATGCMLALEDDQDIIRFYPQPIGTYWLAQSHRLSVDTMYSVFEQTVRQLLLEFGYDALSRRSQELANSKQFEQRVWILRAIEPNLSMRSGALGPAGMMYKSCYVEISGDDEKLLADRGFRESPVLAPRWDVIANETYGSSCPGMSALPPTKGLMLQERRKAQAIDKMVTPPLQAPSALRNSVFDNIAGGVVYHDQMQGNAGVKSLYDVRLDLSHLVDDIRETQQEINTAWYRDLFLAISTMEGVQPRNVMELAERKEEKLLQLGPALERLNDELLDPTIERTFSVLVRRSMPIWEGRLGGEALIPPPPSELADVDLKVEYVSILAQAQKAVGVQALDRLIAFTGNLATLKQDPSVWDKVDADQAIDEQAEMLGTSPLVVRSDEDVEGIRAGRAKQQQLAQLAAAADPIAKFARAGKDMAQTPVGGESVVGVTQAMARDIANAA